jgi:RNA polymerase-binding transcription factor
MTKKDFSWDSADEQILSGSGTDLREEHVPSETEQYMNEQQLIYFKEKLLCWRDRLFNESSSTLNLMKDDPGREIDVLDQGAMETHMSLKLGTCSRYYKLTQKINDALDRIKEGSYGYCEETGEPIGLKRLEARPIATLTLEAQEWHEQKERRRKMRR